MIGRFRLHQHFLGMRAMAEQRYRGDEHCENRHRHGDGREIVLGSFFGLLFQLSKIFGHFERTLSEILWGD
jgi:hypothetical protein